ncbi:MAG: hypothetical protein IPF66_25440 [Holophagales bacterium]|nr:hypothetical protein [Holophagales bacterium]
MRERSAALPSLVVDLSSRPVKETGNERALILSMFLIANRMMSLTRLLLTELTIVMTSANVDARRLRFSRARS